MKKLLTLSLGALLALPAVARDFTYTYEGNTVTYTVIDENAKTCMTKRGIKDQGGLYSSPWNNFQKDQLALPKNPMDGEEEYTLVGIGEGSFAQNNQIIVVGIPNTVYGIEEGAFMLSSLHGVSMPSSMVFIGDRAFVECRNLFFCDFNGPNLRYIGDEAFAGCGQNWTQYNQRPPMDFNVTLPDSLIYLGERAFAGSILSKITIPEKVDTLRADVFSFCSLLRNVEFLGSGLTYIDGSAFSYCGSYFDGYMFVDELSSFEITLPESLEYIGEAAFKWSALSEIVLPDNVKTIGNDAFSLCPKLQSVTVPKNIKSGKIGYNVWADCPNIQDVYYMTTSVYPGPANAATNIFDEDVYKAATLHVAEGMVPTFMNVNPWKLFGKIVDGTSGVTEVDADLESAQPGEIFNLNGVKVSSDTNALAPGLYIVRKGDSVKKIAVK